MIFAYTSSEKSFAAIAAFCAIMLPSRSITADQTDSSHWILFACHKRESVWVWCKNRAPITRCNRLDNNQNKSVSQVSEDVPCKSMVVPSLSQTVSNLWSFCSPFIEKPVELCSLEQTEMNLPKKTVYFGLLDEALRLLDEAYQIAHGIALVFGGSGWESVIWPGEAQLTQDFDAILAIENVLHANNKSCIKMYKHLI